MANYKRMQLIVAGAAVLGLALAESASAQCYTRRVRAARTVHFPAVRSGFAPVAALPTPIYAGRTVVVEQPVVAHRPKHRFRRHRSRGFGFSFSFGNSGHHRAKHFKRSRFRHRRSFDFFDGHHRHRRSFGFGRSHRGHRSSFGFGRSHRGHRRSFGFGRSHHGRRGHGGFGHFRSRRHGHHHR